MTDYNKVDFYYDFKNDTMPLTSDGKMMFVRGSYAVAQQAQFTVTIQQTSWFLQQSLGIPWLADNYNFDSLNITNATSLQIASEYNNGILGSVYNASAISSIITLALQNCPGVERTADFFVNQLGSDLTISVTIIADSGVVNGIGTAEIDYLNSQTLQSNSNNVYNIVLNASKSKIKSRLNN